MYRYPLANRWHISSIRVRVTLWNAAVLAAVLAGLGFALQYLVHAAAIMSVDRELADQAVRVRDRWLAVPSADSEPVGPRTISAVRRSVPIYADRSRPRPTDASRRSDHSHWHGQRDTGAAGMSVPAPAIQRIVRHIGRFMPRVFAPDGRALPYGAPVQPWDRHALSLAVQGHPRYQTLVDQDELVRVYSAPLVVRGEIAGALQVAEPLDDVERGFDGLTRSLWVIAPLALLAAWFSGIVLTDRALRPVRDITDAAARIGAMNLTERLPAQGGDEFAHLAATINGMLGRLEEAFARQERSCEQQKRFTADVSHELRTPLTVIRARTSLALTREHTPDEYRAAIQAADRAAAQMGRILQDLLLLARSDAGQLDLRLRPTPIAAVLEAAVEPFAGERSGGPPILITPVDLSIGVLADHTHLVRLFVNLLENATRWTPPDGRVAIEVVAPGSTVVVIVQDNGPGIAPEHLPHVCERFYRADRARSRSEGGSGLGLAICQSIAEAHNGSLRIASVPGHGTTARIELPRARLRRPRQRSGVAAPAGPPSRDAFRAAEAAGNLDVGRAAAR